MVKNVFAVMDEFALGFSDSVLGYSLYLPTDLEEVLCMPRGHELHGDVSLDQLFQAVGTTFCQLPQPNSRAPSMRFLDAPRWLGLCCSRSQCPAGDTQGSKAAEMNATCKLDAIMTGIGHA